MPEASGRDPYDDRPVDFRDLFAAVLARRWLVLIVALLVAGGCTIYAFVATPIYRAVAILAPVDSERSMGALGGALGQLGSIASLAGVSGLDPKGQQSEEALAVMRSPEFLERFITDRDLLPQLFPGRWDADAHRWKENWFRRTPTLARGINRFNDDVLSATKDKKTGLVTVTVDWRDRREAPQFANDLVSLVNTEMRLRAMAKAVAYTQFLNKELQQTDNVAVREAISRLIEEQIKQRMLASVTQEYSFRNVARAVLLDPEDFVRPKRALLIAGGAALGLMLGSFLAIVLAVMGPGLRPKAPAAR